MNAPDVTVQAAAIVATRAGKTTTWHTLRRETLAIQPGARLKRHDAGALDGARSLEDLLASFGKTEIVYDPTGAFERARRIVTAARGVRKTLGARVVSLHLLPNGRSVYARTRGEVDIDHVAPALGSAFARALSGSDFQIMLRVGVAPPPAGALPLERIGARRERVMAAAQRLSAALAVVGITVWGIGPESADAAQPAVGEDSVRPPSGATAQSTRTVRAIYARSGELIAMHLADEDRGGDQASARRALATVREMQREALDAIVRGAVDGLSARRYRVAEGIAYAVDVSEETLGDDSAAVDRTPSQILGAALAAALATPPAPATPPDAAAGGGLMALPTGATTAEVAANALVRGDQAGAIAEINARFETAPAWSVGVQGLLGTLDGDNAGGAQASLQREVMAHGGPLSVGAFASGVQSTASSGEDFGIVRVGPGVAGVIRDVQILVRGGYASGTGDLDSDGGFARADAAWFVTPDLALGGFVESDPTTGSGAGARVSVKPFTGTLANMTIDADAAWHEDGEESFRLGLRWLLGRDDGSSLRDRRTRRGMAPDLMDDLRRLPDDLERAGQDTTNTKQPYCGEAAAPCPTT